MKMRIELTLKVKPKKHPMLRQLEGFKIAEFIKLQLINLLNSIPGVSILSMITSDDANY